MSELVAHEFPIPLRSETALRDFIDVCFNVHLPDKVIVKGHTTPWRAFADAYFAKQRVAVWLASRGAGKSFMLALLSLTEALTLKAGVRVLGGSGKQSKKVQDYISNEFYTAADSHGTHTAPQQLWDGEPLTTKSRFVWGNDIEALTASQKSARGPHIPRLRLDEADEMDIAILDAAMGQVQSDIKKRQVITPAQTIISSTHHRPSGTMTEIKKRAKAKQWPMYVWGHQETVANGTGWMLQSEMDAKRAEVTGAMWAVEYDLEEPTAEGLAIMPAAVEAMFSRDLGEYDGRTGEYIETEKPQPRARYGSGADWAKKQDYTVIVTLKREDPYRLVAFERRQREPWPRMVGCFDARVKRFRGGAYHDETGVGNVVHDYMHSNAHGLIMTGQRRQRLFSDYIAAIEDGAIIAPFIEWMYTEHRWCTVDDLYGSGHPPDSIVAGAMAYRAMSSKRGGRGT